MPTDFVGIHYPNGSVEGCQMFIWDGTKPVLWDGTITATIGAISGSKSNNAAAPTNDNLGALTAVANASAPSWTEGRQVLLSTDLSGALRVSATISLTNYALETGGNLATIAGKDFATQTTLALIKAKTDNIPALGQALAASSVPVVLTAAQLSTLTPLSSVTVSGSVTANAGTNLNTSLLALEAGGNLAAAKADLDTLAGIVTSARAAVNLADGSANLLTSNSTTYTAKRALDANILGTLGTAFSTAGKVDVKGADGDMFVRQATAANLNMTEASAASILATLGATTGAKVITDANGAIQQYLRGLIYQSITQGVGFVIANDETSLLYNGTTSLTPKWSTITASSSGANNQVSAVTSKKIRVLALALTSNGTVNVKFQSHVTPTDKTGLFYEIANTGFVLPYNPKGWFETIAGEALDINLSASIAVGGILQYVEV